MGEPFTDGDDDHEFGIEGHGMVFMGFQNGLVLVIMDPVVVWRRAAGLSAPQSL